MRFNTLDPIVQNALLDSLTSDASEVLPHELLYPVLQLAQPPLLTNNASENLYALYASLLSRTTIKEIDDEDLATLRQAPPEVTAQLYRIFRDWIDAEAVTRAAEELRNQVLAENEEAKKGSTAIRTFDSRIRLGLALASLPSPPRHLTQALVDTATDSAIMADYRLNALP